jgi:light-regulated signal transduction histidine kinase (bacteriophytochrome)
MKLMGNGLSGYFYREQLSGIIDLATVGFDHFTEEKARQAEIATAHTVAAVSTLAGGVVHGVNNPLTYLLYNLECLTVDVPNLIQSFTQRMSVLEEHLGREKMQQLLNLEPGQKADCPDDVDVDEIADCLNDALIGGHRVREMSNGLAILSRIGEGKLAAVKISDVIDSILRILHSQIKRRATLIQDIDKDSRVLANEGLLAQAFFGLIETMALTIEKGDINSNELGIRAWREGEMVYVEVSHTRKSERDAHPAKPPESLGGTPLEGQSLEFGLLVTKKIIEGYGGTLTENSTQKKGQCFLVCLPMRGRG